jgi:isocitrate dehydrogenase (NAD+)
VGEKYTVFEPTHGSAPKYVGQNKVNPVATMLSGMLLLRHLGEADAANRLESAIAGVIAEGTNVTYDMMSDGTAGVGTSEMTEAVIGKLKG